MDRTETQIILDTINNKFDDINNRFDHLEKRFDRFENNEKNMIENIAENRTNIKSIQNELTEFKKKEEMHGKEFNDRLKKNEEITINYKIKTLVIFGIIIIFAGTGLGIMIKYFF